MKEMRTGPKLPRGRMAELIRLTGLTKPTIWRAINQIQCSHETAITIHRATGGEIPCWDLRPDLWSPGQLPPALQGPSMDPAA